MTTGFKKPDAILGVIDFDDAFVTDAWLIDQFVGNYLYGWGINDYGQIGDSSTIKRSSPVQVGVAKNWKVISAGLAHTLAIDRTGALWAWGFGNGGRLGLNSTLSVSSPTQVSTSSWNAIAATHINSYAIRADGTLWAWGINSAAGATLGLNDAIARSSPVQIGTAKDWKYITGSDNLVFAIKTNGTLWGWGINTYGGVGDNTTVSRSSPVQVGADTNWLTVAAGTYSAIAVKTDGSLWTWGYNGSGNLGQNNLINRSSPTQVGTISDWKIVSKGAGNLSEASYAIRNDGTLWAWGGNTNGELGQSNTVARSSPTQVGTLTNWKNIAAGNGHVVAAKTDGTLWSWGLNQNGSLGVNDTVTRSSPVLIGLQSNWKSVSAYYYNTLAITFKDIG